MTTMIAFHEVEDGERWARAWQRGSGSRHEMMAELGVTVRTFRDPQKPNSTGILFDVSDMKKFQAALQSDEMRQVMAEDGLKLETLRMLVEFTP